MTQPNDMAVSTSGGDKPSPICHRLMFVAFSVLAFSLFAPTIMLPRIQEHCALLAEEERLQKKHDQIAWEIKRHDALLLAFREDATINERLAKLDLRYVRPDEEVLDVIPHDDHPAATETESPTEFASALMIPDDWPADVRQVEYWAESRGVIDLFMDPSLRPVFWLMSAGLIIAAFVLFAPNFPRRHEAVSGDA